MEKYQYALLLIFVEDETILISYPMFLKADLNLFQRIKSQQLQNQITHDKAC